MVCNVVSIVLLGVVRLLSIVKCCMLGSYVWVICLLVVLYVVVYLFVCWMSLGSLVLFIVMMVGVLGLM